MWSVLFFFVITKLAVGSSGRNRDEAGKLVSGWVEHFYPVLPPSRREFSRTNSREFATATLAVR